MDKMNKMLKKCDNLIETLMELKKAINGEEVHKSGYGKIKDVTGEALSEYNAADNAKRKMGNVGDVASSAGPNVNVKAFSSKPGQLSSKQSATAEAAKIKKLNRKQPVKVYTPEEIAATAAARNFKKSLGDKVWANHSRIPSADEEVVKLNKNNPVNTAENLMANQLANMMLGKSMLGTPPPRQPTDQEMFGRFVPSEAEIKKAESKWNNTMNWLEEACKPIASKFASPEEEQAYWDSIKITDRDDNKPGY